MIDVVASTRTTDSALCTLGVRVLGDLGDKRAVPALVSLVGEPAGVGQAAMDSLTRLTGLAYGYAPPLWQAWYEATQKGQPPPPVPGSPESMVETQSGY